MTYNNVNASPPPVDQALCITRASLQAKHDQATFHRLPLGVRGLAAYLLLDFMVPLNIRGASAFGLSTENKSVRRYCFPHAAVAALSRRRSHHKDTRPPLARRSPHPPSSPASSRSLRGANAQPTLPFTFAAFQMHAPKSKLAAPIHAPQCPRL